MSTARAVVVGGGIAGMSCAAALLQAGWDVTVLEQAAEFGEVGAGLAITANGLAAAEALGVKDAVVAAGHELQAAGARDHTGRWLVRTQGDTDPLQRLVGIHRRKLHGALALAAADATLVTGCRVVDVDASGPAGPLARVRYEADGRTDEIEADLVVGADGIGSLVRRRVFEHDGLEYSGFTCWRAVVEDRSVADTAFSGVWGPGAEFGAMRISASQVYWYGFVKAPEGEVIDDELGSALAYTRTWADPIHAIVRATDPAQLMRHDVHHLGVPLRSYVRGRAVLVGDAAHAMIPTMGQGANSSIEDGVTLGRLLAQAGAEAATRSGAHGPARPGKLGSAVLQQVLASYDEARRPRTQMIAARSWAIMKMGPGLDHPWASSARRVVLGLVPGTAAARGSLGILGWSPPPAPS